MTNAWLLGLVLLTGCQGCGPAPGARPAFTPAIDFVGWVDGLPNQRRPHQYFGCDASLGPCDLAETGLRVHVTTTGDAVTLAFQPSLFCDAVTSPVTPIEHYTRKPTVVMPLTWNEQHQYYEARGLVSLSAPGADECWIGSSVIVTVYWEVHSSPLPPARDWSAP